MKPFYVILWPLLFASVLAAQTAPAPKPPIIDMHLHAQKLDSYIAQQLDTRWWPKNLQRPATDDELMKQSLAALERYNVVWAVTSAEGVVNVGCWRQAAPNRIIPALLCGCMTADEQASVRQWAGEGRIKVLGELLWQHHGLTPSDPQLEPVWKLAEELDLPLAIHMGLTPSGWSQTVNPSIRIGNGNPLLLEDALVKHPKARVYVMHAGWPYIDAMVAMLYQYPGLYAELGWIDWYLPRKEFHAFLKRLVDAGFAKRSMFGSDQMQWPEAIGLAIEAIESADFLTDEQKRDILYNNAARFLKLTPEQIAAHHRQSPSRGSRRTSSELLRGGRYERKEEREKIEAFSKRSG